MTVAPDLAPALRLALPTGALTVTVGWHAPDWPLARLCGFGARCNARRGFLVVSRVLGRHVPVRPAQMRAAHAALAARLPDDLPGPVLFVALAETAIALGCGVWAAWGAQTGRRDATFLHSTRVRVAGRQPLASFREEHSHAPGHLLHDPGPAARGARTLVLVDDEASTGATFRALGDALAPHLPRCERVVTAVLTDWSGQAAACLLRGRLDWAPDSAAAALAAAPPAQAEPVTLAPSGWGRLGVDRVPLPDPGRVAALSARLGRAPLALLGTGEFVWPACALAAALESHGHDVVTWATTRSPALVAGEIGAALTFADAQGEGVPNYLYNWAGGRRALVLHEGGVPDPALLAALGADSVTHDLTEWPLA